MGSYAGLPEPVMRAPQSEAICSEASFPAMHVPRERDGIPHHMDTAGMTVRSFLTYAESTATFMSTVAKLSTALHVPNPYCESESTHNIRSKDCALCAAFLAQCSLNFFSFISAPSLAMALLAWIQTPWR